MVIGFFLLSSIIGEFSILKLCLLFASAGLFLLFYNLRRIQFDDGHVYRIYGKSEKALPFSDIQSIKRSGIKVNGTRLWKVTFSGKGNKERKFLFKEGTFQHGSTKQLIEAVKKANPSVVIWHNPFFNHSENEEE